MIRMILHCSLTVVLLVLILENRIQDVAGTTRSPGKSNSKSLELRPPSRVQSPPGPIVVGKDHRIESYGGPECITEYEVAFVKGWNHCLKLFSIGGFSGMDNVRLIDTSQSYFGERGLNEGFTACLEKLNTFSKLTEQSLMMKAKNAYVDAPKLRDGFQPDLAVPATIRIPDEIGAYVVFALDMSNIDVAFTAANYRTQYSYDWSEFLFNYGFRGMDLDDCGESIRVIAYPKPPYPASYPTSAHSDCRACLETHLKTYSEAEIRSLARSSIRKDYITELGAHLNIGIKMDQ